MSVTIAYGADHNAESQSDRLKAKLEDFGDVLDVQSFEPKLDNYVDISSRVCNVTLDHGGVGVITCGTGIGVSIVANKHRGIYAARCVSQIDAKDCKMINNANVLCLSAKTDVEQNVGIIEEFFAARFEAIDRRMDRVRRLAKLENQNFRPTRVPLAISLSWRGPKGETLLKTQYLSATGAFLSCDPNILPDGPLSLSLPELGSTNVGARVVHREIGGVAIEFDDGQEDFFHTISKILAEY